MIKEKTKTSQALLDEFVTRIQSEESFSMADGQRWLYFASVPVGEATYVYGEYYFNEDTASGLGHKLELVAIIADGKTYIVKPYSLVDDINSCELPGNTVDFGTAFNEMQKYIKEDLLQEYMDALENPADLDAYREEAKKDARRILLGAESPKKNHHELDIYADTFASYLCGFTDLKALALEAMDRHKGQYLKEKAYELAVDEALGTPGAIENWELWMAKALQYADAKNVMVTFLIDGKEYEEKLLCGRLLYCLRWNQTIDSNSCFPNWNHEKEFLPLVHAESSWKADYRPLTHKDITTIKYRGRIIYKREEGEI